MFKMKVRSQCAKAAQNNLMRRAKHYDRTREGPNAKKENERPSNIQLLFGALYMQGAGLPGDAWPFIVWCLPIKLKEACADQMLGKEKSAQGDRPAC